MKRHSNSALLFGLLFFLFFCSSPVQSPETPRRDPFQSTVSTIGQATETGRYKAEDEDHFRPPVLKNVELAELMSIESRMGNYRSRVCD